jgi:hypothetical protein
VLASNNSNLLGFASQRLDRAAGDIAFAKLLAETAGAVTPALNWFNRFTTEAGRIDLKHAGLVQHYLDRARNRECAGSPCGRPVGARQPFIF